MSGCARADRGRAGAVARARGSGREVGAVAVAVGVVVAVGSAEVGQRVAQARGRRAAFIESGSAETDQVDDRRRCRCTAAQGGRAVDECDLARGGAHRGGAAGAHGLLDKVVAAGGQGAGQRRGLPRRACGAGVLNRVAAQVDCNGARIEQLDEVIAIDGAGVAASALDLADDEPVARYVSTGGKQRRGGGKGDQRALEEQGVTP